MRTQVKGAKFAVYDADGVPVCVGDTVEWQETAGRYGQTKRGRGVVTHSEISCGWLITDGGAVGVHWEWKPKDGPEGLYCRHEHHDYEHGHKTWARVVTV